MKLLVFGGSGQLGSEFEVYGDEHEVRLIDRDEVDITDHKKTRKYIREYKPDIVLNTAALTNLEKCEDEPKLTFDINTLAQYNIAKVASEIGARVVFYSTDYVFGGDIDRDRPYIESERRSPVNVYAASKVAAEDMTAIANPKHFILRVAVLFGKRGSAGKGGNFVESMIRLGKERDKLSVVTDQIVSPTHTKDIAKNTMKLLETEKYGTYHMVSQGETSFYDFAKEIFDQTGLDVELEETSVDKFEINHTKPKYTVLENSKLKELKIDLMPHWQEALKEYLVIKKHI